MSACSDCGGVVACASTCRVRANATLKEFTNACPCGRATKEARSRYCSKKCAHEFAAIGMHMRSGT